MLCIEVEQVKRSQASLSDLDRSRAPTSPASAPDGPAPAPGEVGASFLPAPPRTLPGRRGPPLRRLRPGRVLPTPAAWRRPAGLGWARGHLGAAGRRSLRPRGLKVPVLAAEEDGRLPGQGQHPHQHPRRGARGRGPLVPAGPRLPQVALRGPDGRGDRAGLFGVDPHCGHVLPALPFLRLGDVCGRLLLDGDSHTLCDVSLPASAETLHDPLAHCAGGLQHCSHHPVCDSFCNERYVCRALLLASFAGLQQKSCCLVLCLPGDDFLRSQLLPQLSSLERIWKQRGHQSSHNF